MTHKIDSGYLERIHDLGTHAPAFYLLASAYLSLVVPRPDSELQLRQVAAIAAVAVSPYLSPSRRTERGMTSCSRPKSK